MLDGIYCLLTVLLCSILTCSCTSEDEVCQHMPCKFDRTGFRLVRRSRTARRKLQLEKAAQASICKLLHATQWIHVAQDKLKFDRVQPEFRGLRKVDKSNFCRVGDTSLEGATEHSASDLRLRQPPRRTSITRTAA